MTKKQGKWLKVFCPDSRCLTEQEIYDLPEDLRKANEDKPGLWLEMFCPDDACLKPEEGGPIIEPGKTENGEKGLWLRMFCPEDSCEITEPTDLP